MFFIYSNEYMIARGVVVNTEIELRAITVAQYIIDKKTTVRSAAKQFGISKSTVHKDVTDRLYYINRGLYEKVQPVLAENKACRHLRGGMATKEKYLLKKQCGL